MSEAMTKASRIVAVVIAVGTAFIASFAFVASTTAIGD